MSILKRILRLVSTTRKSQDGVSSVEFALAAPMLAAILALLVDFGMGFYEKLQVYDAAQAGAQYAVVHGWDSTAIENAVTNATTLTGVRASPSPAQSCGCPSSSGVTSATCGSTCSNGLSAGTYVTVNAQVSYSPLMTSPILGSTITLTAQSIARIQ
jgi:Flp pilus assembly protein TadG